MSDGCVATVQAGMTSINDFAATYMSQSLPFGGVKESGFGRFGGIEGLRALCIPKAVTRDRYIFPACVNLEAHKPGIHHRAPAMAASISG